MRGEIKGFIQARQNRRGLGEVNAFIVLLGSSYVPIQPLGISPRLDGSRRVTSLDTLNLGYRVTREQEDIRLSRTTHHALNCDSEHLCVFSYADAKASNPALPTRQGPEIARRVKCGPNNLAYYAFLPYWSHRQSYYYLTSPDLRRSGR